MRSAISFRVWVVTILFVGLAGVIPVHASPSAFSLLLPEDGATVSTSVLLDWEDSTDPDGLTYTLYVAQDEASLNIDDALIQIAGLGESTLIVREEDGIADLSDYYWKVDAIGEYGDVAESEVRQFKTENTANPIPAWVGGYIYSSRGQPVANATVTINVNQWGSSFQFTTDSSGYFLGQINPSEPINPGTEEEVLINITADGYDSSLENTETIKLDGLKELSFSALEEAVITGNIDGGSDVNLTDAILVLQVLTGKQPSSPIDKEATLNKDGKIDLGELVYILVKISTPASEGE